MEISVWFALLALFFAGGLTPGPAAMLVMSTSLRYGPIPALIPATGISTSNLLWITLAATGLATFAASFPAVLLGIKIAGICFITWLAWTMVSSKSEQKQASAAFAPPKKQLFARGAGLQLLNPNALVFFGLLLPGYFDASRPILMQVVIMMVTVTITEMVGLTIFAFLAGKLNVKFQSPSFAKWFNRSAAGAMLASALFATFATSH
ncbi:MAG: LysE family translocator [Hyphomonas sp.]